MFDEQNPEIYRGTSGEPAETKDRTKGSVTGWLLKYWGGGEKHEAIKICNTAAKRSRLAGGGEVYILTKERHGSKDWNQSKKIEAWIQVTNK